MPAYPPLSTLCQVLTALTRIKLLLRKSLFVFSSSPPPLIVL